MNLLFGIIEGDNLIVNIIGVLVGITSIVGTVVYVMRDTKATFKIEPYEDYEIILEAALQYKEKYGEYAKEFTKLIPFIEKIEIIASKRYSLSLDGKFVTILGLTEKEATSLINEIGGDSYINGKLTYLTLRRKNELSKIKPIAHFNIRPDSKITTTTVIEYDTSGCIAENNEIAEKKWENKHTTFKDSGTYTVKLKIRDAKGNWSDSFERDIKVTEEVGIRSLVAYDSTMFLIYRNGKSLSVGKNEFGQLGIGSLNPINEFKYNTLYDGVEQISLGENFSIFKMNDATVCAAGSNRYGELASGDKNSQKTINAIWGLENIKQIASGKHFSAALDFSGNVYVWGDNSENQLMREDVQDSLIPVKLEGLEGIKSIALGSNFGFGVKYDGTVVGWGDNTYGQLGVGYKGKLSEPVITLYKNVANMTAGDKFSLAVTENGRVFGAGNNTYGQLGTKGKSEIYFPAEILKIKDVAYAIAKEALVIGINNIGKAYIWGSFGSPGSKPVYEPEEVVGISYIGQATNTGKKCFVIDGNDTLFSISDLSGKYETKQLAQNFYDLLENELNSK